MFYSNISSSFIEYLKHNVLIKSYITRDYFDFTLIPAHRGIIENTNNLFSLTSKVTRINTHKILSLIEKGYAGSYDTIFDKFYDDAAETFFSAPFQLIDECTYYMSTSLLNQTFKDIVKENVRLTSFQNLINIFADKVNEDMGVFNYLQKLPSYWNYYELKSLNFFPSQVTSFYNYDEILFLLQHTIKIDSLAHEYTKHINFYNDSSRVIYALRHSNVYNIIEDIPVVKKNKDPEQVRALKIEDSILWTDIYSRYDYSEITGPRNIPDSKMYYPEPFIASPSFHHEDIWFIHVLHYQYWLWFFFISIIIFFFITFINVVKWCNMRNKPRKETRGVSRSKCADLITASVPVTWAASIIVAENVDATDYYDGFGTGEIVIGVRAYQWGWEYFYPKTIDLQYNVTPSYSQLIGNSLKYSNTTTQSINLNKFWKFYQQKTNNATSTTPSNLLLNPTSKFNILNINSYNKLGLNLTSEAEFSRHINYYTKNNPQYLYNSITDYNLKYQKINNLYLNENDMYNSVTYGGHRQLQYTNFKSTLNRNQNFFEKKSMQNFLNYNEVLSAKGSTPFFYNFVKTMQDENNELSDKTRFATYDFYANSRYQIVENALWETSYSVRENLQSIVYPEDIFNNLKLILMNWRLHILLQYYRDNPDYLNLCKEFYTEKYADLVDNFGEVVCKNLDFYTRTYDNIEFIKMIDLDMLWHDLFERDSEQQDWQGEVLTDNPTGGVELSNASLGTDAFSQRPVTVDNNANGYSLELALGGASLVMEPIVNYIINDSKQAGLDLNYLLQENWSQSTNLYSYNNFVKHTALPYGNYINFINELNYNESEMSYAIYKNIHNYYNLNYNNIMNVESQLTTNISYLNMFNNFKLTPTDDYLVSNLKSLQNNYNYTNFLKSTNNVLKLNDEIDFMDSTKSYVKKLKSTHKVYKSKFDENRSFYHMLDVSNSYVKYPFVSDRKFKYNYLLSKNSEYYFATTIYNTELLNNFNDLFVLSNSLNTYISDLPFLTSIKNDASRYLWFDWFTRWSSIEVSSSKPADYNITGLPFVQNRKLFGIDTTEARYWGNVDHYMSRIAKGRRNYMSSWSTTPYFYTKINDWYKFYYNNSQLFQPKFSWRGFINFVKVFQCWTDENPTDRRTKFLSRILLAKNQKYTPSYSLINIPKASYYKDFNKRQFAITGLVDILSRREFLYRQYYSNCHTYRYLPVGVQITPQNPILNVVKSAYNFHNPTVYSTEFSREFFYGKQSYIKFLLLKDIINWNYDLFSKVPVNVSKVMNYLYFQVNNEYNWSNQVYNSSTALKNQFRPMRKGITNMLKLHTTGAVAMPIEIRLHFVASSKDIIHSWAIPSAGIKIDCLPGFSAHRVLIFLSTGIFWGQCMEVCGRYHHWMPIVIYFMKRDLFFLWCTHFIHYSSVDDFFTTTDRQLIDRTYYRNLKTTVWADELIKLI